jgi:hypothetical protein
VHLLVHLDIAEQIYDDTQVPLVLTSSELSDIRDPVALRFPRGKDRSSRLRTSDGSSLGLPRRPRFFRCGQPWSVVARQQACKPVLAGSFTLIDHIFIDSCDTNIAWLSS